MAFNVEGIILNSFDYGEKSKIIKILTPSLGIIGVFVSNANKISTKKSALVQPLTCAYFNLKSSTNPTNDLYYLYSGEVENFYFDLKQDYEKVTYVYCMVEIILKGVYESNHFSYLYKLFKQILWLADGGQCTYLLHLIFQLKMLSVLGIKPVLDYCVVCQTTENILMLNIEQGGIVCSRCIHLNEPLIIDASLIPIVRALIRVDLEHFPDIKLELKWLDSISHFLEAYYESYSGLYLNTKKFIKAL